STGTIALLQTSVPDGQRGRVMGTQFLFSRIAGGIGTYLVGSIAEHHGLGSIAGQHGPAPPLLILGGGCVLGCVPAYAQRRAIQASFLRPTPAVMETETAR